MAGATSVTVGATHASPLQRLQPYAAYKDSGVPWLGAVPEHWDVRRLKYTFRRIVGGSTPSSDETAYWGGDIVWVTPADVSKASRLTDSQRRITRNGLSACSAELVPPGSIVVTSRAPVGSVAIADVELCTNQGCKALVPDLGVVAPMFGFHMLCTLKGELQSLATSTTFTEISMSRIGDVRVPLPPLPEQAAIVRFLDYVDRRIRRYIRAKQKLIKLLEEYKQAIIHRAITGQIDVRTGQPYPAYKPSGVEWLREVPEHWEVRRLKSLVRNVTEYADYRRQGELFIALEHVESWSGRLRIRGDEIAYESQAKCFQTNDVLFGRLRPYLAKVTRAPSAGVCVGEFLVLRPRTYVILPGYLEVLLRLKSVINVVNSSTFGAKMPRTDWQFVGCVSISVPPLSEQSAIVSFLDELTAQIDAAMCAARRQVELLREYRTRLIADVVTGKLDVRGAAARLPEEAEEKPLAELETEDEADPGGFGDGEGADQEGEE